MDHEIESNANLVSSLKMSRTRLSRMCSCLFRKASNLSSTISLTLLSDSLETSSMKHEAAAGSVSEWVIVEKSYAYTTFHGSRIMGKAGKSCCCLVLHGVRGRGKQFRDTANIAWLW